MLVQEPDNRSHHDYPVFKSVGKVDPTPEQWQRLYEGWTWCRHIRSNTVMIMDPHANIIRAIGSGQPSRIGAARLAIQNAGEHARGGILISDSFTPKPDVAQLATEVGIGAMLIPSGSLRDNETTEIANKAGIPIVRGRERSFWH
jgi:phosphoribosylaminoimidazolecarboxamide formyltransferase/IMP cyclohydrolase